MAAPSKANWDVISQALNALGLKETLIDYKPNPDLPAHSSTYIYSGDFLPLSDRQTSGPKEDAVDLGRRLKDGEFAANILITSDGFINQAGLKFLLEAGVKNPVLEVAAKELGIKWDKPKEGWAAGV